MEGFLRINIAKLLNLGVQHHNSSLSILRQRTINIANYLTLAVVFSAIIIRGYEGSYLIVLINLVVACSLFCSLYFSSVGNLNLSIVISNIVLIGLTSSLFLFDLTSPSQCLPHFLVLMMSYIIVHHSKTNRFIHIGICLVLIVIFYDKLDYTYSNIALILLQVMCFAFAFNFFVNFLESQDATLNKAISKLENLNSQKDELNDSLAEKNEELLHFSHIMSHDLKAPLRTINSFSQIIQRRMNTENTEIKSYFDFIINSAKAMQQLIDDLLTYSQVEAVKGSEFKSVNLAQIGQKILSLYQADIAAGKVIIDFDELGCIEGNRELLNTLFRNLISNSLKYQPKNQLNHTPTVRVFADTFDGEYRVFIEDNGIGIKPEFLDELFTPFRRFHSMAEYEGSGLGMSICKRVMDKHQGRIKVLQTSEKGTLFQLTFKHSDVLNNSNSQLENMFL